MTHRPSNTQAPNGRRRLASWILAAIVVPWLVGCGGGMGAVSENGATLGLEPKFIDVPAFGTTINTRYYEAGQGEPVVLVHGGGFDGRYSANHWDKVITGLGERVHVFAPDKLAAGMTDNPPDDKDLNIHGEVEHIYRFIQTLEVGRVHLVGQSRGAGLVMLLSAEHPDVLKTVTLIDSATASPEEACPGCTRIARDPCSSDDPNEYWRCLMRNLCFDPDLAFDDEYWVAGNYMASLPKARETVARKAAIAAALGDRYDNNAEGYLEFKKALHERIRNEVVVPVPMLLYWAVNDPQAPALRSGVALYDIYAQQHPNVRMSIINNAGHFFWREHPDEFIDTVVNFIDYWKGVPPVS
jgi:pimeloyl-ACP methyl ester carboxylesterase